MGHVIPDWWLHFINGVHTRIEHDFDYVIVNTGDVGTGKSSFSLLFATSYDPNFTIDNVFFSGEEMIKAAYKRHKGSVLILDEAGYALNPRDSMTRMNKDMAKILTVVRERNLVLMFNAPHLKDIDKSIRDRRVDLNVVHEVRKGRLPTGEIFYARGYVTFWERESIHVPYRQDDVRWHFYKSARVPKCNEEIYRTYTEKKANTLREMATEEDDSLPKGAVWISDIEKNYVRYFDNEVINVSQTELSRLLGVSQSKISKDITEIRAA